MNKKKTVLTAKQEMSISNAPLKKKISFFSAMLIVVGSSIGAGIFLRSASVLNGSQGSMVLAMFAWLLAAFAVIAMALALVEVVSANTNNNLSLIGWCKQFNNRTIYKASKNFMFFVYLPLTYFFLPLYVLIQLQDGIGAFMHVGGGAPGTFTFGTSQDALIWTVIGLGISLYFIFGAGLSSRIGNIQNWIITSLKFIPLVIAGIIGFVYLGVQASQGIDLRPGIDGPSAGIIPQDPATGPISLGASSPVFGVVLSIVGIFFAFDGFYIAAGLQTEMKEPKKTPLALLFGLLFVTAAYLLIAVSMSLNGDGSFFGFGEWLANNNAAWLYGLVNVLIAVGILGILNGFAMWAPRFTADLISEGELPFSDKFKNQLNSSTPKIGIMYSLVITLPIIVIFTLIGTFGYIDNGIYSFTDNTSGEQLSIYGSGMEKLLPFADLTANWTALFAFGFIVASIAGCLKNRKTRKVVVEKQKYFVPMAYISVILISIAISTEILVRVFDLFLLSSVQNGVGANTTDIVSRIMLVVALAIVIGLSFLPTVIEDYMDKKRGLMPRSGSSSNNFENKTNNVDSTKANTHDDLQVRSNINSVTNSVNKIEINIPKDQQPSQRV